MPFKDVAEEMNWIGHCVTIIRDFFSTQQINANRLHVLESECCTFYGIFLRIERNERKIFLMRGRQFQLPFYGNKISAASQIGQMPLSLNVRLTLTIIKKSIRARIRQLDYSINYRFYELNKGIECHTRWFNSSTVWVVRIWFHN